MRKPLPKLVLRKETVRALSDLELGRAIGGYTDRAQGIEESTPKQCGVVAVVVPRG
jgi:hypothetical protein